MLRRASLILRVAVLKVRRRRGADRGYGGTWIILALFFFQAEDGIRDHCVTGVQTSALPISSTARRPNDAAAAHPLAHSGGRAVHGGAAHLAQRPVRWVARARARRHAVVAGAGGGAAAGREIGRASCRERVEISVGGVWVEAK